MKKNRVPKGVASGGQFAVGHKAAPSSSLVPQGAPGASVPPEDEFLYQDREDRAEQFRDVLDFGTSTQKMMLCREDDVPHDVVVALMSPEQPLQVRASAVTSRHPAARELGIRDANPVVRMLAGVRDARDHDVSRARALLAS